jgi:hypothetical protein
MKAIARRLSRMEHRMGLVESAAAREVRIRLLDRLEAGRRRVAAARGESVPTGVRPLDYPGLSRPGYRPPTNDALIDILHAGRERVRAARAELAG